MPLLNWLTRDQDIKTAAQAPYRLLEEVRLNSYGDQNTENMIIQGDNLEALKALRPYYEGRIKCIYIDPPYNTRSAFDSYDDNLEHAQWLALMYPRLELLWTLLTEEDGVILISINDDEGHYLKVICDEIFGRKNFIASLVWNYEGNTDNQAKIINYHEYIFVYSKSGKIPNLNTIDPNIGQGSKLHKPEIRNTIVKNGPKNPIKSVQIPAGFPASFEEGVIYKDAVKYPQYSDDIIVKDFKLQKPVTASTGWSSRQILEDFINSGFKPVPDSKKQETTFEIISSGAIDGVKKRDSEKGHFVSVLRGFGTTNQMRLMLEKLGLKFSFPKPIDLVSYLVKAFTDNNSIVLDSFAGSGTTGHSVLRINSQENSNRKFILVEKELGSAHEIIVPRLKAVIDGDEVAELERSGGGFRFYKLGMPVFDNYGHISPGIKFRPLAAHLWFAYTGIPYSGDANSPLLGIYEGLAYYLLYNGILGDKRPQGGNVLTTKILAELPPYEGEKVIFGEGCRLSPARLQAERVTFRQIPYEIKAR